MRLSDLKARLLTPYTRRLFKVFILLMTSGLSFTILWLPIASRPLIYTLSPGDVAPQDIEAPYSLSYISEVLTEQARLEAEQKTYDIEMKSSLSDERSEEFELFNPVLPDLKSIRKYQPKNRKTEGYISVH